MNAALTLQTFIRTQHQRKVKAHLWEFIRIAELAQKAQAEARRRQSADYKLEQKLLHAQALAVQHLQRWTVVDSEKHVLLCTGDRAGRTDWRAALR